METKREDYANHFLTSVESIWEKQLIEPSKTIIIKTGEAVYDVDNYQITLEIEPETKPREVKG